jgi:hypothetical protein
MIGRELVQLAGLLSVRVGVWINAADHPENGRHIPRCTKAAAWLSLDPPSGA